MEESIAMNRRRIIKVILIGMPLAAVFLFAAATVILHSKSFQAYALASMTMDCRIGQPAAAEKVVHCLVPKSLWVAKK